MRTGLLSLSGYNVRAVVALCRWAASADVPLHLVARSPDDALLGTHYADRFFATRTSPTLSIEELSGWVQTLRTRFGYGKVMLVPSTEFFNRFILRHRRALEAAGAIVPLVDEALYHQLSDKAAFTALCETHGIAVPRATQAPPADGAFVAKPLRYGVSKVGRIKPYLINSDAERASFLAAEDQTAYFYQEYVTGASLYLLLHISRDGRAVRLAQENLMQQGGGGSVILARPHTFHAESEAERYVTMLRALGFFGLIMIEVRRELDTGRTVMIEANPRLWGPMQFTLDQGTDFFSPWLADFDVHHTQAPNHTAVRPAYYFWSGGLSVPGQPVMYHNFSPADFVTEYAPIAASDLFARPDTYALYHTELVSPVSA